MASATELDNADEFRASQNEADKYPCNLVRTETFGYALERYCERLKDGKSFNPSRPSVTFLDLYPETKDFQPSKNIDTLAKLNGYLDEEDGSPYWRMVFILSANARMPLGCSREQLAFLFTYYQVMPSFLDFVFTFRHRSRPVDHAIFRQESYLDEDSPTFRLNAPARSGFQIQHAFNLLSVERAKDKNEAHQWPLRQVALYHSFDVQNGRTVWIFLKGNNEMLARIRKARKTHRDLKPSGINSPESSFAASLQIHNILVDWCADSWAQYIDNLEDDVNDKSVDAKVASVDEVTTMPKIASSFNRRSSTLQSINSSSSWSKRGESTAQLLSTPPSSPPGSSATGPPSPISPRRSSFSRRSFSLSEIFPRRNSGFRSGSTLVGVDEKQSAPSIAPEDQQNQDEDESSDEDDDSFNELAKSVSFGEFQRLNLLGDELEQAHRAIEQNRGVLNELKEHYEQVTTSFAFTKYIKTDQCAGRIAAFLRRIRKTDRDLETHQGRLKALCQTVENDKTIFNTMLTFKSEKTSEFFALSAKASSEKMEDYSLSMENWTQEMHKIAVRTEQETVSMHIITIFTLIFLPGTFLATFFSSGIFRWDEDGNLGYDWVLRPDGMRLFFYICGPMMALILVGWLALYLHVRRKGQKRMESHVAIPVNGSPISPISLGVSEKGMGAGLGVNIV